MRIPQSQVTAKTLLPVKMTGGEKKKTQNATKNRFPDNTLVFSRRVNSKPTP